jgi:predicted small lipoprotein YifL
MTGKGVSLGVLAGISLLAAGCGRKGALIYPDMLVPEAPSAVSARQSGSALKLQFAVADRDRTGRPLAGVTGVKISRRAHPAGETDVCNSCSADYVPFQTLYFEHLLSSAARYGNVFVTVDTAVTAGTAYSYRMNSFTADGIDGAAATTPDARVALPVLAPTVRMEAFPTELKLFVTPLPKISGALRGYNVYRYATGGVRPLLPLNSTPLQHGEYVDSALERGIVYRYAATVLVESVAGIVESAVSEEITGQLKDDE